MLRPRRSRFHKGKYLAHGVAEDRFGNEIAVGDFIQYVLFHAGGGSGAGIFYGYVTKIGKTGKVDAQNIKLSPNCTVEEKTIKDSACIIKMPAGVEKAWKDHLMMSKLSAE